MKKIHLIFALCLLVCACTFQTKHRGYVFPENLESEVASLKTTAQLEEKFGSPQVKTIYGTPVWIYYGADENYRGPLPLTYDNKTVLLAWNDGAGKIMQTKILHDADLPEIEPADGETEIPAAIELNALQELFNNVGRFKPAGLGQ
ncbi:MAG: hypothetical protein LBD50_02960 [Rickettsiales bacterium]|jgi:outer membrane protein assembly factor BamE (lipoprotein component of BamABCDE complex)|nr:hypothetical protein [Rickettsiales bacterium]